MNRQNETWLARAEQNEMSLKSSTSGWTRQWESGAKKSHLINFAMMSAPTDETYRITRLTTQLPQCRDSLGGQSALNFKTYHEHKSSMTLPANSYAGFREGNVVRGILCPSLTNSFRWDETSKIKINALEIRVFFLQIGPILMEIILVNWI